MKAKFIHEAVSFERGKSPKGAMGIGLEGRLYKDLEKAGYDKESVDIDSNFVLVPKQDYHRGRYGDDELKEILVKHMDPKKSALAKILMRGKSQPSKSIQAAVAEAYADGLSKEVIEKLVDHYSEDGNTKSAAKIQLTKLTRTKEKEQFEEEYNTYVFIGYTDKIPVEINGKKYYEDKFVVENMVKIDMYDPNQLNMIHGMKLRTRFQNYPDDSGGTYAVKVPKILMDEESYSDIPEHMQEIVEKYKFKV